MRVVKYAGLVSISMIVACSNQGADKEGPAAHAVNEASPVQDAKRLFETRCAGCHGNDGTAGINNASNLQTSQLDGAAIFQVIQNGRGNMPSYKSVITENELKQLSGYVNNLKSK